MTVQAEIEYGNMKIELEADNAQEFESELQQILGFLNSNQDNFQSISLLNENSYNTATESGPRTETTSENKDDVESEDDQSEDPLSKLSSQFRVPKAELSQYFIMEDDYPTIYLEDESILGEKKTMRQRKAALILLYLWKECYEEKDRVKSSDLKDAIQMSGISQSNLANIYQGDGNTLFDRSGRGASATVGLTPRGKREARDAVNELIESLRKKLDAEDPEETTSSLSEF